MRFFKAFNLLHRRTKSDTFVSGSALSESPATDSEPPRRSSVPVSFFDLFTSQTPANFKHFSDHGSGGGASIALPVFSLEKELNARLIDASNLWAKEYANLQSQLQECREELHTERREVQRLQHKLEEDNKIMLDLRMSSGRDFEGLLGVSNVSSVPNFVKGSLGNVMNIRTMDEYSCALRMTLATRKELHEQKKVALFWKRKALDGNQLQSSITPSVSTLSFIHDPLPIGRQIALDALISRRGLNSTLGSQMGWKDASSGPPKTPVSKLSTYRLIDEVGGPIAITRLPVMSSENSSSRLGPLASESIKAEISSLFGSPNSVKHLISRKPSHSPSLTRFTFATAIPVKKTDLTLNVESFGDLHANFETTLEMDKLVDESNDALNRIDMQDDDLNIPMTFPPTLVQTVFKTSNIPTRRRAVTSAGSEVTANTLNQASKGCTSHRSRQSCKAQSATSTTYEMVNMHPKRASVLQKPRRGKENSFAKAIPTFKRKTLSNSTQDDI